MWTATLKSKTISDGKVIVTVNFSDGVRNILESVSVDAIENLKAWVAFRINKFTAADAFAASLTIDEQIDPVPITATPTNLETWLKNVDRLDKAMRLVDLGVIQSDNAKLIALRNKVIADMQASFIDAM